MPGWDDDWVPGDRLRTFTKPLVKPASLLQRIRRSLPKELTVRLLTLKDSRKGFRPTRMTLVTTLLDEKAHPRQMIEKEIYAFFTAYNLIRGVMADVK